MIFDQSYLVIYWQSLSQDPYLAHSNIQNEAFCFCEEYEQSFFG